MAKPTRIVEEPKRILVNNIPRWVVRCDNGVTYNSGVELAKAVGLNQSTISKRLGKGYWDHKLIFAKKMGTQGKRKPPSKESPMDPIGKLGPRMNLDDIPSPSKLEEELWK